MPCIFSAHHDSVGFLDGCRRAGANQAGAPIEIVYDQGVLNGTANYNVVISNSTSDAVSHIEAEASEPAFQARAVHPDKIKPAIAFRRH